MKEFNFMISSLGRGGAERNCVTLANALCSKGTVNIYVRTLRNEYVNELSEEVNLIVINSYKDAVKILKNKIVYVYSYPMSVRLKLNSIFFKNKPFVITRYATHMKKIEIPKKGNKLIKRIKLFIYYNFHLRFIKLSDLHVTLNPQMKQELCNNFHIEESKVCIINNVVSDSFHNLVPVKKVNNDVTIVSRVIEGKGFDDLIQLALKLPKVSFKVYGEGILLEHFQGKVKEMKIDDRITFYGRTENMLEVYSKSKLILLPSYREGSPNVLLEAISCGIPVVAYDCLTGPRDIINNNNGTLVPLGNIELLLNAVMKELHQQRSIEVIKSTAKDYKIKNVLPRVLQIITNEI